MSRNSLSDLNWNLNFLSNFLVAGESQDNAKKQRQRCQTPKVGRFLEKNHLLNPIFSGWLSGTFQSHVSFFVLSVLISMGTARCQGIVWGPFSSSPCIVPSSPPDIEGISFALFNVLTVNHNDSDKTPLITSAVFWTKESLTSHCDFITGAINKYLLGKCFSV